MKNIGTDYMFSWRRKIITRLRGKINFVTKQGTKNKLYPKIETGIIIPSLNCHGVQILFGTNKWF